MTVIGRAWTARCLARLGVVCLSFLLVLSASQAFAQRARTIKEYAISIRPANRPQEVHRLRYLLIAAQLQRSQSGRARAPLRGVFIETQRCNWRFRVGVSRVLTPQQRPPIRATLVRFSRRLFAIGQRSGSAKGYCNDRTINLIVNRELAAAMPAAQTARVRARIEADARNLQRDLTSLIPNSVISIRSR